MTHVYVTVICTLILIFGFFITALAGYWWIASILLLCSLAGLAIIAERGRNV